VLFDSTAARTPPRVRPPRLYRRDGLPARGLYGNSSSIFPAETSFQNLRFAPGAETRHSLDDGPRVAGAFASNRMNSLIKQPTKALSPYYTPSGDRRMFGTEARVPPQCIARRHVRHPKIDQPVTIDFYSVRTERNRRYRNA